MPVRSAAPASYQMASIRNETSNEAPISSEFDCQHPCECHAYPTESESVPLKPEFDVHLISRAYLDRHSNLWLSSCKDVDAQPLLWSETIIVNNAWHSPRLPSALLWCVLICLGFLSAHLWRWRLPTIRRTDSGGRRDQRCRGDWGPAVEVEPCRDLCVRTLVPRRKHEADLRSSHGQLRLGSNQAAHRTLPPPRSSQAN